MERFSGGVFSPALTGGRAGASLHLTDRAIEAETHDGHCFTLLADECEVSLGGASGRMWFCRERSGALTLYCEQRGFAQALRQANPGLSQQVQQLLRGRRIRALRSLSWLTLALALLCGLLAASYLGLRAAGRAAVQALPADVDQEVGQLAIGSMDLGGPLVHDPRVTEPITLIVGRLAARVEPQFEFHAQVVDADVANAFALPGGEIVVYTGLLRRARRAEEVAAVIAHEMVYVTQRHGIQRIAQSIGIAATVQLFFGDVSGLSALASEMLRAGALTSYDRDQERAADRVGLRLLHRSGLPPLSMADLFSILEAEEPRIPEHLDWLSTHPNMQERIARVRQTAKALGPTTLQPLGIDYELLLSALGPAPVENPSSTQRTDAGVSPSQSASHHAQ